MNEFLKVNWRLTINHLPDSFISEDDLDESIVYEFFENPTTFRSKPLDNFFKDDKYIPGLLDIADNFDTHVKSTLDKVNHKTCLRILQLVQSGKDPSCYTQEDKFHIEIFKKLKPKILEENAKYLGFVQQQWERYQKFKCLPNKPGLVTFGERVWQQKWANIHMYPKCFNEINLINLTVNEGESDITYTCSSTALDLGSVARFSPPNLQCPVTLTNVNLPDGEWWVKHSNSRMPVSKDKNIDKLVEKGNIDLVISASSLKCLSDLSDSKRRWMIPFIVKNVECNGAIKRVVFIDKPYQQNDLNHTDFTYISHKRLIKTNFCQFQAFKFDEEDTAVTDNKEEDKSWWTFNRHHNKIHYNASYKVWNIKKTCVQSNLMKSTHKPVELNVLIRSKLDACELNSQGSLQPVILKPKLELQHKFGANVASKSELAREWASLFFTPFSNLYRVRITAKRGEVIAVEKCNIQKVVAEAQALYQYKPQTALSVLQNVFERLTYLQPGNYLLQHLPKHEAFVAVLKECEENSVGNVFDFHAECEKVQVQPYPKSWLPIDVNFILPSFEAADRMPGLFTPVDRKVWKKGAKKGNKGKQVGDVNKTKVQGQKVEIKDWDKPENS